MRYAVLIIFAFIVVLFGCKPNSSCPGGGGKGGTSSLAITPIHSNYNVDSCMIYIKYGAIDAPTNNIYDDSQKVSVVILPGGQPQDTIPYAVFNNLKSGNYYIFGNGWHVRFNVWVKGGIPVTICNQKVDSVLLPTFQYQP